MMKRIIYLTIKSFLPYLLFPLFFILLFDLLNFNVEIYNSHYLAAFSLIYSLLAFLLSRLFDKLLLVIIQYNLNKEKKMIAPNKMMISILLQKVVLYLLTTLLFMFVSSFFKFSFEIKNVFIYFLIVLLTIIINFVLISLLRLNEFVLKDAKHLNLDEKFEKLFDDESSDEEEGEK